MATLASLVQGLPLVGTPCQAQETPLEPLDCVLISAQEGQGRKGWQAVLNINLFFFFPFLLFSPIPFLPLQVEADRGDLIDGFGGEVQSSPDYCSGLFLHSLGP